MPPGIFHLDDRITTYYQVPDIPVVYRNNLQAKFWTRHSDLVQYFPKPISPKKKADEDNNSKRLTETLGRNDKSKDKHKWNLKKDGPFKTTRKFPRYPPCLMVRAKTPADRIVVINWWLSLAEEIQKYWLNEGLKKIFYRPNSDDETIREHQQLVASLNHGQPMIPRVALGNATLAVTDDDPTTVLRKENADLKMLNKAFENVK